MNRVIYSVSQVNAYIKQMFSADERLMSLCVRGEISNCKYHSSGHLYFTIKDRMGQLSCVMFASNLAGMNFVLSEGMSVVVYGSIRVFERDGKYQMYAQQIEQEGTGLLFEQTERLKRRLEEEGLFLAERKKKLPRYIKTLGIVTADTGAAIRDMVQIAGRRNPYVQLILCPAPVQGIYAVPGLVGAIRRMDAFHPDVMIIGRGGGSAEDLMAFNDEAVVRAVAACATPVVSAVGHETDVVLTDYAADLRAPTPSAAAELTVFLLSEWEEDLATFHEGLTYPMFRKINTCRSQIKNYNEKLLRLGPEGALKAKKEHLNVLSKRIRDNFSRLLLLRRHKLELLAGKLATLSPAARLSGGFAYVTVSDRGALRSIEQVSVGDRLGIRVSDGVLKAEVTETEKITEEKPFG